MNTTLNHCLYSICEVYAEFFDVLAPVLTTEIFERLEWCVQQSKKRNDIVCVCVVSVVCVRVCECVSVCVCECVSV